MAALLCISEHLGSGLEQESMFCFKFPETEQQKCWLQGKTFFFGPDSFESVNICAKIIIQQIFKNLVLVCIEDTNHVCFQNLSDTYMCSQMLT